MKILLELYETQNNLRKERGKKAKSSSLNFLFFVFLFYLIIQT
ncbi:unnamed protein product [Prunus brigantina]